MQLRKYEIEVESSDWVWSGEIEAENVEQAVDQAWNVLADAIVGGAEISVEFGWMQLRDWQELPEYWTINGRRCRVNEQECVDDIGNEFVVVEVRLVAFEEPSVAVSA